MDGVIVVDKPSGPTSFDIVAQVRRQLGTRQVGHAGTLDPLASGVLVVMVGQATKLSDYLTAADKTYVAQLEFGRSTDTLDSTGTTTASQTVAEGWLTSQRLYSALDHERARVMQVPPQFSAIKQAGKKSYAQARQGKFVEHAPRPVAVRRLDVLSANDAGVELELRVSKGYYVRSLVRDLCETLGVAGCLTGLRRTASGSLRLDQARTWPVTPDNLIPTADAARIALPAVTLTEPGAVRARHGKKLTTADFVTPPTDGVSAWYAPSGQLMALGEAAVWEPMAAEPAPSEAGLPQASLAAEAQLSAGQRVYYRVVRGFG